MNRIKKNTARTVLRFLCLLAICGTLVSPANAGLKVTDGTPVTGATMGGADGAVQVNVTDPRAIVDWKTLDTDAGELLEFLGDSGYWILNRVQEGKPTDFMGNIEAFGGNVIIVNPYGMVFGPQSEIQAASFTASSLMIDEQDFLLGGVDTYIAEAEVSGEIVNEGHIHAKDKVALLAQRVINRGDIVCDEGAIVMATGDKVILGNMGSDIIVEIEGLTATGPSGPAAWGDVINEGSLDAGADIVLAAGDTFAQSLTIGNVGRVENVGEMKAQGNLEVGAIEEAVFAGDENTEVALDGDVSVKAGAVWATKDLVSGGDMTIESAGLVQTDNGADLLSGGAMSVTSGDGSAISLTGGVRSGGDMLLDSGSYIFVQDDMVSGGDMTVATDTEGGPWNNTYSTGNLIAEGDINLNTNLELSAERWVLNDSGTMVYDNQVVDARTGTLTSEGWIARVTAGELHLHGGSEDLAVDLRYEGPYPAVSTGGNLYISGKGDIQIGGDLDAMYPGYPPKQPDWEDYEMPYDIGGVSVISQEGKIYTRGTDGLNVAIYGYSNDVEGEWISDGDYLPAGFGVDLPHKDEEGNAQGKAAIVLQSKEDLVLGPDSALFATGKYLPAEPIDPDAAGGDSPSNGSGLPNGSPAASQPAGFDEWPQSEQELWYELVEMMANKNGNATPLGVDDRPGVDFLNEDAVIGGYSRDQGIPSDVAIYAASTDGDVIVDTPNIHVLEGYPEWLFAVEGDYYCYEPAQGPATVVFDADDTVTFGQNFMDLLLGGVDTGWYYDGCEECCEYVATPGYRIEVSSRRTEWLNQAVAWETLPYAADPEFIHLLLGGEDADYEEMHYYELRGAGGRNYPQGHRAWVLEDQPPMDPAPLALAEFPELKGCPVELAAVANELGVGADKLQMSINASLAMNPNIQACDTCAQLVRAATVLKDFDGGHMAAMNVVFNQLAPANAPFTPETASAIIVAFSEMSEQNADYALASTYVDAFVQYVAALGDLGSPVGDSVAFVMAKHGKSVMDNNNANIAAYIAAMLEQVGG